MNNRFKDRDIVFSAFLLVFSCLVFFSYSTLVLAADKAKEVVEEDPTALSKTPQHLVSEWDAKKCKITLSSIGYRVNELHEARQKLYRDESNAKRAARSRKDLPREYREVLDDIERLKKEIETKVVLLGQYMNNLDVVKDIRKQQKSIDGEWSRLIGLRGVVNERADVLRKTANTPVSHVKPHGFSIKNK